MIDYNQDIAPLRQQYFPMLAGERGFDQAMKYRQEVLMPMQQQTMKMQQMQKQIQLQDLAFKKSKFELRQVRDKAKRDSEAFAMKPVIDEKLNSLLGDETKTASEKFVEFGKLSLSVAPYLTAGSPLSQMFNATSDTLKSISLAEEQQERKALREKTEQERLEAKDVALIESAAKIGDFDLAKDIDARTEGTSIAERLAMAAGKQAYETSQAQKLAAEESAKAQAYQKSVEDYTSTLKTYQSSLANLKYSGGGIQTDAQGNTLRDSKGDPVVAEGSKLEGISKQKLIGSLKFLYPSLSPKAFEAIIKNSSDVDLLRLAQESIAKDLAKFTPVPNAGGGLQSAFD